MEQGHHHGQGCCGGAHHGHEGESGCGHDHGGEHECCGHGEGGQGFQRRFRSKEELIVQLEEYRTALQQELKAVEERIANLRSAG